MNVIVIVQIGRTIWIQKSWKYLINMKYPHTPYFRFSLSVDKKDVRETGYFDNSNFLNKDIIFTTKMDGSNCLMTSNRIAARNGLQANHSSFDYAKVLHAKIKNLIPENYYVYGEWLYAKHSIFYDDLNGLFQIFAVYNSDADVWLSWHDVCKIADVLGFVTVDSSESYKFDKVNDLVSNIKTYGDNIIKSGHEGIVVRNINSFNNFNENVAKYVRPNHVRTNEHWTKQKIVRNVCKSYI